MLFTACLLIIMGIITFTESPTMAHRACLSTLTGTTAGPLPTSAPVEAVPAIVGSITMVWELPMIFAAMAWSIITLCPLQSALQIVWSIATGALIDSITALFAEIMLFTLAWSIVIDMPGPAPDIADADIWLPTIIGSVTGITPAMMFLSANALLAMSLLKETGTSTITLFASEDFPRMLQCISTGSITGVITARHGTAETAGGGGGGVTGSGVAGGVGVTRGAGAGAGGLAPFARTATELSSTRAIAIAIAVRTSRPSLSSRRCWPRVDNCDR